MEKDIRLTQWAETQPLIDQQRAAQALPARAISIPPTPWATRVAAVALVLIGGLVALAGGCRRPAIELPTELPVPGGTPTIELPAELSVPGGTPTVKLPAELSVPGGTPIPVPASAISSENADRVTQLACWGTGTNSVQQVVWSPDGKVLAQWSGDGKVRLWEVATGRELPTLDSTSGVAFSPDGKILAYTYVSPDRSRDIRADFIYLWHTETEDRVGAFSVWDGYFRGDLLSIAFSPDGKTLASGEYATFYTTINLWAVAGERHLRTLSSHSGWIGSVAFSPDSKTLASGSYDTTIKLWDVAAGRELRTLSGHSDWVGSVAFSPDGKTLASASGDHTVKLWDVASGREVRTLSGHTWYVQSVVFSPDGKVLASASGDHTIKLWDVASGREVRTLSGHTGSVFGLAFSPDGRVLASGSRDGTLCLWGVPGAISPMPAPTTVPTPGTVSPTPAPAAQASGTLSPALEDCVFRAIGTDLGEGDIRKTAGRIEWSYEPITATHVRVRVERDGTESTSARLSAECRPGDKSRSTELCSTIWEYAFARNGDNCEIVLRYTERRCSTIFTLCPETTPTT